MSVKPEGVGAFIGFGPDGSNDEYPPLDKPALRLGSFWITYEELNELRKFARSRLVETNKQRGEE